MPTARFGHVGWSVGCKIYVMGGYSKSKRHVVSTVDVYDPVADSWMERRYR